MVQMLKRFKRLSRSQQGLTVVELTVYLVILLLVLAVAYEFLRYVQTSFQRGTQTTQAQQSARLAVKRTVGDLRQMQPFGSSPHPEWEEAGWDRIRFSLNVDADADLEQVQYVIVDGELKRRVYQPRAVGYESETTVARGLANQDGDGRRLFEYFQTSGGDRLTNPDAQRNLIRLIEIRPIVDTGDDREFTLDSEVYLRNLGGT